MNIIPQIASAMQAILTTVCDTLARTKGFIKRQRKFSGSGFVQTLVFGWLSNPAATNEELAQTAATIGIEITPKAIEKRFTKEASFFLLAVLQNSVKQVIATDISAIPIFDRFNGVYLTDSSTITLPDSLADVWKGCGGSCEKNTQSGVKIQVRWDIQSGALVNLSLQEAFRNDRSADVAKTLLPCGSLHLADLGYFSLSSLKEASDNGGYWLTRLQAMCAIFSSDQRVDLVSWLATFPQEIVDVPVSLGVNHHLPARLVAGRVTEEVANKRRRQLYAIARRKGKTPSKRSLALADWTLLVTNVPTTLLCAKEVMVLVKVRWQIELLFKLWKSHGQIDCWSSKKPWRILCEFYAKLVTMIIQHWVLLIGCWQNPNRSLVKAVKVIAKQAYHLAEALACGKLSRLCQVLSTIARCLAVTSRISKRRKSPSTFQLLLALSEQLQI